MSRSSIKEKGENLTKYNENSLKRFRVSSETLASSKTFLNYYFLLSYEFLHFSLPGLKELYRRWRHTIFCLVFWQTSGGFFSSKIVNGGFSESLNPNLMSNAKTPTCFGDP